MKLRYFLIALILIILVYNYQGGFLAIHGAIGGWQYSAGDLPHALESYEQTKRYMHGSGSINEINYNEANVLYKKKSYETARKLYESMKTNDPELERMRTYNLANTYYRLGEDTSGTGRIAAWQQSIASYERSLRIAENRHARENYEFVKKKLTEETKRQEEQQKEEERKREEEKQKEHESDDQKGGSGWEKSGSWSGTWSVSPEEKEKTPKGSESTKTTPTNPQPGQTWTNQWGYNPIAGGTGTDNKSLDANEARELEQYGASLKEFQKQNGKYLNPNGENPGSTNGFMDQFFSNPMLQDALPGNEAERDW